MSKEILSKNDLVKRINYHSLFQQIAHELPSLIMGNARSLTASEVKVITDLNGNVTMIAIALCYSIKVLYKAIPDYDQVKNLNPSSYSTFLYNAMQGLTAIDHRLLKPPLLRLFGDSILIDDAINESHSMFAYIKMCGGEFVAECKKPMVAHYEAAIKESFLSNLPYRTKNASYDQHQLIYFPVLKPPGSPPPTQDKWQLHYLASKHYNVPVSCTAALTSDRYKVFYENVQGMIDSAKQAAAEARGSIRFQPMKQYTGDAVVQGTPEEVAQKFNANLGFKKVEIKITCAETLHDMHAGLEYILLKLGKLGKLVNENTKLVITNVRKRSSFDRQSQTIILNTDGRYYECKLGYLYGQALDRIIATKLFNKKNHLGSDYWFLCEETDSPLIDAIVNMYQCLTYQRSPHYIYSATLIDGLFGKHFFMHPGELFARALSKCVASSQLNELQVPESGHGALLYPNSDESSVFELALENVEAHVPENKQASLLELGQ
ncbi:hypothetical protein [Alteromonas macleodii]|uniref:Uncharacterized protein n=1 Tax=Alteromonas macleodii TaxID=28108 RepID=A0AB36FKY6_ALTMA|nr:hypothetical protein [Alteromonas macleodii]OES24231.1 hypothetical protein BFV93_4831 [Alteromonas macleodii]OES24863.1 hypothetical protein BFV95_4622 [Alteromonas macleodii]OES25141.1 hypothetical protein BFV94_4612 [Alteromonas macleodii]OES39182.1 hypothetical protein BFV96_4330 [Alteromonas macleodii]